MIYIYIYIYIHILSILCKNWGYKQTNLLSFFNLLNNYFQNKLIYYLINLFWINISALRDIIFLVLINLKWNNNYLYIKIFYLLIINDKELN